jgi:hypothetical protein
MKKKKILHFKKLQKPQLKKNWVFLKKNCPKFFTADFFKKNLTFISMLMWLFFLIKITKGLFF